MTSLPSVFLQMSDSLPSWASPAPPGPAEGNHETLARPISSRPGLLPPRPSLGACYHPDVQMASLWGPRPLISFAKGPNSPLAGAPGPDQPQLVLAGWMLCPTRASTAPIQDFAATHWVVRVQWGPLLLPAGGSCFRPEPGNACQDPAGGSLGRPGAACGSTGGIFLVPRESTINDPNIS